MASFSNLKFENAIKQTRARVAPQQRGKTSKNNKIGVINIAQFFIVYCTKTFISSVTLMKRLLVHTISKVVIFVVRQLWS
jgi:hypothetical protein